MAKVTVDTVRITQQSITGWKNPPFQRPLRVNAKVKLLAEQLKADGGVLPGVITLGKMGPQTYLLDGQHRVEAFRLSGLKEGWCDIRIAEFESMGEMGQEYVDLNSSLVRLRPDDILRGLEGSHPGLAALRKRCPFVGYDMIRRGEKAPMLSASAALRCWFASEKEVPTASGGCSSVDMAELFTKDQADRFADFLGVCVEAWSFDAEYAKLWGALNLTIVAWLYRRTVLGRYTGQTTQLTKEQFKRCITSLSAQPKYLDYLHGRLLGDRDRGPCYRRVASIVAKRLEEMLAGKRVRMPQPAWSLGGGGRKEYIG